MDRKRSGDVLWVYTGLLCVCAGFLVPFLWMASTSLKSLEQTRQPGLVPRPLVAGNYAQVFRHPNLDFALYTRNTLIVAMLTVAGATLSSALVAYGFPKSSFAAADRSSR